jgi:hypothetical protein
MSKRIPVPPEVCRLDGAVCPGISSPHRFYVAYPVVSGVQPCLLAVDQPNGITSLDDAPTVLPTDAPYFIQDAGKPNYGNYLSLIQYELRAEIDELQSSREWGWATNQRYIEQPFRSKEHNSLLDAIECFLQAARNNLPSALQPTAAMLANRRENADVWFLETKFDRAVQDRRPKNWKTIERWPEWNKRKLRLFARFLENLADLNQPEPNNRADFENALEAFKQRYLFLRLKLPVGCRSQRRGLRREWAKRGWH